MNRSSSLTFLYRSIAAAALLQAAQGYAAEVENPMQLLTRMSQSTHTVNYEGVFVYSRGNQLQCVRIIHGVDGNGEYERLITLSGKSREVIRNNDEVTRVPPGDKPNPPERSGAHHPIALNFIPNIALINDHYELQYRGSERIAEREADHVAVLPRDHYRYGHGYWVDQTTGLLLRADVIGEQGHLVEQMMFTSLSTPASVPRKSVESSAQTDTPAPDVRSVAPATQEQGAWEAASLPPGFTLSLLRHHPMPGRTALVEHHVYSDGLATVSVFIEPDTGTERGVLGRSLRGAVHAYGRVFDGKRIVAVGEVPAVTVEQIAEGMRPRQEKQP